MLAGIEFHNFLISNLDRQQFSIPQNRFRGEWGDRNGTPGVGGDRLLFT